MLWTRYKNTLIVGYRGKVFFLPLISWSKIRWWFVTKVFNIREDIDCDGITITYTDKLTDGLVYYWHYWNFSRVGGSIGTRTVWFDKFYSSERSE